jgi:hypothetical protein
MRLLSVGLYTRQRSGINWMMANRTLKKRMDSVTSVGVLGVLIALEVLTPAEHWQEWHAPGPKLAPFVEDLEDTVSRKGMIDWDEHVVSSWIQGALCRLENLTEQNLGWAKTVDLISALELRNMSPAESDLTQMEEDEDEDSSSLDELLREAQKSREQEQLESLVAELS